MAQAVELRSVAGEASASEAAASSDTLGWTEQDLLSISEPGATDLKA